MYEVLSDNSANNSDRGPDYKHFYLIRIPKIS